jgi:hypothetical protein
MKVSVDEVDEVDEELVEEEKPVVEETTAEVEKPAEEEKPTEETPGVQGETPYEILFWNETTYEHILANCVSNQKEQFPHNVTRNGSPMILKVLV